MVYTSQWWISQNELSERYLLEDERCGSKKQNEICMPSSKERNISLPLLARILVLCSMILLVSKGLNAISSRHHQHRLPFFRQEDYPRFAKILPEEILVCMTCKPEDTDDHKEGGDDASSPSLRCDLSRGMKDNTHPFDTSSLILEVSDKTPFTVCKTACREQCNCLTLTFLLHFSWCQCCETSSKFMTGSADVVNPWHDVGCLLLNFSYYLDKCCAIVHSGGHVTHDLLYCRSLPHEGSFS